MKLLLVLAVGSMAAVPLLAPSPAQALTLPCASVTTTLTAAGSCTISDGANTYSISNLTNSFANAFPAPSTVNMFWWGNESKAISAARAVGYAFGAPSVEQYFAYNNSTNNSVLAIRFRPDTPNLNQTVAYANNINTSYYYAKSTLVTPAGPSAAVPGPLPVLGVAAAFGFSRKLRKRLTRSTNSAAGTLGA
jgi:hypothetical protein